MVTAGDDLNDQMKTSQGLAESVVPNGAAWAALLAASIGALGFGIVTDISECSAGASKALLWYRPAGSLSGVAGVAILIWVVLWGVLHALWRTRRIKKPGILMAITLAIAGAAIVTTFPPFYELLGG
jgi:hypothetical protein